MVKTVFGMPGAGDKSKGGDAVAPGGAPGATGGTGLPQKSGKESPQTEEQKETLKQRVVKQQQDPEKKPSKAPMAVPTMAKPASKKPAGGKTVFGMPAMKLPIKPSETAQRQKGLSSTQPVGAKPMAPVGHSTPVGLKAPEMKPGSGKAETSEPPGQAQSEDAYKATVLGVGAVSPSAIPKTEEPADTDARTKTIAATEDESPAQSAPVSDTAGKSDAVSRQGAQQPPLWLLIVLISIIAILMAAAAYFIFDWMTPS
jgi:hypothetical protein